MHYQKLTSEKYLKPVPTQDEQNDQPQSRSVQAFKLFLLAFVLGAFVQFYQDSIPEFVDCITGMFKNI